MRLLLFVTGLLAIAASAAADVAPDVPPPRPVMRHYVNARFAYSVDYPASHLQALPEAENGDGEAFTGYGAEVRVWGSNNVQAPAAIAAEIAGDCGGRRPTYRLARADLVAVSCISGGQVIYQKTLIRRGRQISLRATYPVRERRTWDGLVSTMASSLRAR